ncbi:sulfotransferase [Methylomarinum vadi]|uniref:sulfotransferase n=1 Tax=Methylomarinum vadi TaxID=438855 RepID=UPI0004DEFEC2|nr:sulfotransferase [Methylomarinum vadi]
MDAKDRIEKYKVNNDDEVLLDELNAALSGIEYKLCNSVEHIPAGAILITGVPRSGSMFLYQYMISKMRVGYVSNMMARFYSAPYTGAWLQSRLISSEMSIIGANNFKSVHGVTDFIYEPHEFGYFWANYFPFYNNNHEDIDHEIFRKKLKDMEYVLQGVTGIFKMPVVYKCMIAPFVLDDILKYTSVFIVHILRDKNKVVDSILKVRSQRLGTINKWWSIRPSGWEEIMNSSPREQVSWQYDQTFNAIEASISSYPERNVTIKYEDLVNSPEKSIEKIEKHYNDFLLKSSFKSPVSF